MSTLTLVSNGDFENSYEAFVKRYRSDYSHNFSKLNSAIHMNVLTDGVLKDVAGRFARAVNALSHK